MLVKKVSFRVNSKLDDNEDGVNIQKGIEAILDEYKKNNYFSELYKGYSDLDIKNKKAYVTEYEEQEFRGYIEECQYEGEKNYRVYIKDYKGECFHIGYVPLSKVPEVEEWLNDNNLELKGNVYIFGGKIKSYDENNDKIIIENKDYEFEVELRFYKQDTLKKRSEKYKKTKLNINKKYIIIVIGLAILVSIIIGAFNLYKKPKFEITDFSITSKTTDYTSIKNSTTYNGKGLITTSDKKEIYVVAMKVILKSGGDENSIKEYCTTIMVNNGKGEFTTYDSGDEGKITKPEYDFEIIGYITFKK